MTEGDRFFLLAAADAEGQPDVSLKGGTEEDPHVGA